MLASVVVVSSLLLAGGVTYRCRDADGQWTEAACHRTVSPNDLERQKAELADPRRREQLQRQRAGYRAWCAARERDEGAIDRCVVAQMDALSFLTRRLTDAAEGSEEARMLADCLSRSTDRDTRDVDAIAAKDCYAGPGA
jgi:hypothetical protein